MSKQLRPKLIESEELQKKSTKELLGYLKKLRMCEESFSLDATDYRENPDNKDHHTIWFKDTSKWKLAYSRVKSILDTRDHVHIGSRNKRFTNEERS